MPLPWNVIEKFVAGVKTCRSIDCVLANLSAAFFEIKDFAEDFPKMTEEELVRKFLSDSDVWRFLAGLTNSIDAVKAKIRNDVRLKNLRPYTSLIIDTIKIASEESPPKYTYRDYERPPLWRIEYDEKAAPIGMGYGRKKGIGEASMKSRRKGRSIKRWLGVFAIILVILAVIFGVMYSAFPSYFHYPEYNEGSSTSTTLAHGTSQSTTIIIWSSTTSSTSQQYRKYVDLGTIKMHVNNTYLVIEQYWNDKPRDHYPYFVIEEDGYYFYLVPFQINSSGSYIIASYVFVNKTYTKALFPVNEIVKKLSITGVSNFEIDLYDINKVCNLHVDWSSKSISFQGCEDVFFTPSEGNETGNTFYDVIFDSFNETTFRYLLSLVYNGTPPGDVEDAAWKALEWVDDNIKYNFSKASLSSFKIYDPITFAKARSGVCSDYAVFLAATLLSANVEPTYILELNTQKGPHATAAVEINNTLFALDQHLPPVEWSDYPEYVFNVTGYVYVYKISYDSRSGPTVEFYRLTKNYTDTYPSDAVSSKFAEDVCKKLGTILGTSCTHTCMSTYSGQWEWSWDIFKLYSPTFHKQWVDYIAKELAQNFRHHPSCIWIKVKNSTSIVLYYRG